MDTGFTYSSFARKLNRAAAAIAVIGALAIITRFVYLVSQIEAGWSTAAARWRTTMFRQLTSTSEFVTLREPPEQADYWLAEADRIVSGPGDEAPLAMGAACILDAPAQGYVATRLGPAVFPGLQKLAFADTGRAEAVFESRCRAKCLELAKRATDLQPANVNWWRMRALLTFGLAIDGTREQVPRTGGWQTVLADAARHDPDNALYDYLAATHLWRASSDYHPTPQAAAAKLPANRVAYTVKIRDEKQFAAGVAKFNQGQRKKFVAGGEAGLPAIAAFLEHSRLMRGEQADVASSSRVVQRSSGIAIDLFCWQTARADDSVVQGDPAQALVLDKQSVHAFSQIAAAGETQVYDLACAFVHRVALSQTLALAQAYPRLVKPAELRKLAQRLRAAMLREKVLSEAGKQFTQKPNPPNAGDIAALAVYSSTPASVSLLLIGGWLAWAAGRWLGQRTGWVKPLATWQHAMLWLASYSVVFAVAGMAPAEMIPANAQPWIAIGSVACDLLVVGFLLWRARFRFTLRAAFIMIFVCAVLCVPLAALHEAGALDDLSTSLRILPVGVGAWDAATLQKVLRIDPHSWVSATWQWFLRSGYFYSAVGAPLLVALWWGVRRAIAQPGQSPGGSHAWWAGLLREVGRSALALAAILLLVDLVLAPRMLAEAEANYQQRMLIFRDPAKSYAVSRAAIAAVERDRPTMAALRQTTDEEMEDLLGQGDAPSESTGR